jgi:acetyltransferase-like isoleucine patch superfamily enzyme
MPIEIGDFAYIGSEIRVAPGGAIPSRSIVGIGAVITKPLLDEQFLIGGVPAKAIRPLSEEDQFLITRKTRRDLPDEI